MKLRNLFLIGLASAVIFAGCKKEDDLGPEQVSIDPAAPYEFPVEGGEYLVELTATVDWAMQGYDESVSDWLSITPSSGKASASPQFVTIKALSNDGVNRKADLVFYGNIMHKASLTITQKGAKGEAGTVDNPFTVTDAIQFIKDGGYSGNENASDKVYVEGEISQIKNSYDSEHGSANYIISDGTNELEVYGGKFVGGIQFTKEDQIKVGDKVVVYGQLTDFNGTYEFIANNYIYSLNGETTVDVDQTVPGGPWIYSHSFVAGIGDYTIDNKKIDEALSHVWSFDNRYGCMKASAYIEPTNYETESWLISPVIDLTSETSAYLTFEHATNFFNTSTLEDEATVWAKEDGTEGWSKLTGVTYPSSQGWTFVDAGDIDITAYAGKKMQIAFVYKSTASKAGTWEVKNIVVKEEADEVLPPVEVTEGSVTLTFPDDNSENNKISAYTETWTAVSGEYNFAITAFNNNNWNNDWKYIKCGRKNNASVATISTATAMPKLTAIDVTVDKITVSKVNSITLSIYSDATLSTAVVEGIEPRSALATGSMVFEIPAENQAADQYYKLTFDCAAGSSNGLIQISKVTYIAAE